MTRSLRFHPRAQADLLNLYTWIAQQAGTTRAGAYITRIEAACRNLASFPLIGRPADNLGPGLRLLGFERRAAIIYRAEPATVDILAIYHGGRDLQALELDHNV